MNDNLKMPALLCRKKSAKDFFVALAYVTIMILSHEVHSFAHHNLCPTQVRGWCRVMPPARRSICYSDSALNDNGNEIENEIESGDDEEMDDETLLKTVPKSKLAELCRDLNLSEKGTKKELLERLRAYAKAQADLEKKRHKERIYRVEEGGWSSKERFEILDTEEVVDDEDEDEDEEDIAGFFYYPMTAAQKEAENGTASAKETSAIDINEQLRKKAPSFITSTQITAPPPPPTEPDENGERVVTVYSSKEQNDLTGVAAAQPGRNMNDALLSTGESSLGGSSNSNQPWDFDSANQKTAATSKEIEIAKEKVTELIQLLLSMTGAPGFRYEMDGDSLFMTSEPEHDTDINTGTTTTMTQFQPPDEFVGFDPSKIPASLLSSSSQALRAGCGQVLQDVLREVELHAIGQDGMAGDDIENGGGHYREVSKVRAFLEGFRQAEIRRLARETVSILLDKLITEGIQGLDLTLATMTRGSDDTNNAGELNDSLITYLNDAIRQQQQRVELEKSLQQSTGNSPNSPALDDDDDDSIQRLWNVTEENGTRLESLDPNDPTVQKILQDELSRSEENSFSDTNSVEQMPESAPEKLLLLLTLLRERIKTEATYGNDEDGHNLRMLAYCLRFPTASEREQLIMKEMGNSLDRMDSFIELISSSIEYAESTTHLLQPSKTKPLNVKLLKSILSLTKDIRKRQTWKASGFKP